MDINTGLKISDELHLQQSITNILTTSINTRAMRRDYGSNVFNTIDKPTNDSYIMDLNIAISGALIKWEPRLKLNRIKVIDINEQGKTDIEIIGLFNNKNIIVQVFV